MVPAGRTEVGQLERGARALSGWMNSASAGCRVSVVLPRKVIGWPKPTTLPLQVAVTVPTPPWVMSP